LLSDESGLSTFEEAFVDKDKNQWMEAMKDELEALMANHTWNLVL